MNPLPLGEGRVRVPRSSLSFTCTLTPTLSQRAKGNYPFGASLNVDIQSNSVDFRRRFFAADCPFVLREHVSLLESAIAARCQTCGAESRGAADFAARFEAGAGAVGAKWRRSFG